MAPAAFISATPLVSKTNTKSLSSKCKTTSTHQSLRMIVRASPAEVVEKYFPSYQRNRAPTIEITGDISVSLSMKPIEAFTTADKSDGPLLDYSDPSEFVPTPITTPSPISWPSGDGRSVSDFVGVPSLFNQPNLKIYGPFPDFYKRSCEL